MAIRATKVEVWAGEIEDRAGGLAAVLGPLGAAGASLECVIARRQPDRPGKGIVFLAPVRGKKAEAAAASAGLVRATNIATLRVEGPDKPGLGARMARAVADAGVSMRGLSAMARAGKFVGYVGFDSPAAAEAAAKAIRRVKA